MKIIRKRLGTLPAIIVSLELILEQISVVLCAGRTNFKTYSAMNGDSEFILECPIVTPSFKTVLWLVHEDHVLIGASVEYDHEKYRYLASNGQLVIKDVTFAEAGVYRCIVTMNSLAQETSAVELIVKRNYDNEWDDEFKENMIRGSIAGGILMGVLLSIYLIYKCRYKAPAYKLYNSPDLGVSGRHIERRTTDAGIATTTSRASVGAAPIVTNPNALEESITTPPLERVEEEAPKVRGDILVGPPERRESQSRRESSGSFLRRLSIQTFNSLNSSRRASEAEVGRPFGLDSIISSPPPPPPQEEDSVGPSSSTSNKTPKAGSTILYVTNN